MSNYAAVNILDMVDAVGEDAVTQLLSDFSCPENHEIESFVQYQALDFAKRKMSVTYLVMDNRGNLAAIYTLTHKALELSEEGLSATIKKKLSRFAQLDEKTNTYTISAFLIAQFGKNHSCTELSGVRLMEKAFETLTNIQRSIGGGVVYLECEENPKLLSFYESDDNRFRRFNERYSEKDNTKYIQLFRFF